jgi:4-diphosphocytidyl-2-C-methyl-D-erythritol kinase
MAAGGHSRDIAKAKINLALHVVGARSDGYRLIETLVVFADVGDVVEAAPGPA